MDDKGRDETRNPKSPLSPIPADGQEGGILSRGSSPLPTRPVKPLRPLFVLSLTILLGWTAWAVALRDALLVRHPSWDNSSGVIARLFFWVAPAFFYLFRSYKARWSHPLGLGFPLGTPQVVRTLFVTGIVALLLLVTTAAKLHIGVQEVLGRLTDAPPAGLGAPIFEELVFRGVILSELLEWTHSTSNGLSQLRRRYLISQLWAAAVFLLVHFPYWVSHWGWDTTLKMSPPLFATGLVLGFVFAHTRSIWACILLHWLNNQMSLL